ncbi:MAG: GMC family oxidoreductase [Niabella sp.]
MSKYDLIAVGTGFATTFFLKKYLEKNKGKRVLVLERGHFIPHAERLKMMRKEHSDLEKLYEPYDTAFTNHHPEKKWPFSTGLGGCSNCWWGCTPRFMPSDFKLRSLYGIEEDWPVDYEALDPYYEEAEEIMCISGPDETPFPRKKPYPLPAHRFAPPDRVLHEKYGVQYISQPTARASRPAPGRNQCYASSTCDVCPVNAKFTIENSQIGVYETEGVTLQYGSQVYALVFRGNKVTAVRYIKDGAEYTDEADYFLLGANPFFNSNILLNSGDDNPLVGRGFGEQLGIQALIYLKDMNNKGGSTWVNANGYMLYDGDFRREYASCLMETNNAPYIRLERGKWLNIMSFRMVFEDLPQMDNYIKNTGNKLKPEVYYKAGRSSYALKAYEEAKKKLPDILSCLPVEKIEYLHAFPNEGHIIGGTRMGTNEKNSVVDKYMIHHRYRNLYVLGAGSYTTYSAANPTLTLAALSLFSADNTF